MLAPLAALNGLVTCGEDVRAQFLEADAGEWWLAVAGGEARVGVGAIARPDVRLRASTRSLVACFTRPPGVDQGVPDVSIDGVTWAAMFPFGAAAQPSTVDAMPNVSLTVQHINHLSPIGVIRYHDRFVDGRLAARESGVARHPDVVVENTFERMIASLQPGASMLEAIAGARVHGRDPSMLMLAAALYEDDGLRRHLCPTNSHHPVLCALASNTQSPAWLEAVRPRGDDRE